MAGKRMLHKNICISDKLNQDLVNDGAENLYYRALTHVDDYGIGPANPHTLKDLCYPKKAVTPKTISARLKTLSEAELITIYEVNNVSYFLINRFEDFQLLRKDRPKTSLYPPPNGLPTDNQAETNGSPKVQVKVKEEVKGEEEPDNQASPFFKGLPQTGSLEDRLVTEWRSKNPDQARAYPKQLAGMKAAIVAAQRNGWTAQEIEAQIWSTAGKGIPPWELFKNKPSRWDRFKKKEVGENVG